MIGTFKSRGTLAQSGPSRLSMRFTDPAGEAIVIDGTSIWIYTPSTAPGQVLPSADRERGRLWREPARLAARQAHRALHGELPARRTPSRAPAWTSCGLTPAVEGLPFTSATLWVARSDALPRRIEVTELSGNHRTLTLSKLRHQRAAARRDVCVHATRPASRSSTSSRRPQHRLRLVRRRRLRPVRPPSQRQRLQPHHRIQDPIASRAARRGGPPRSPCRPGGSRRSAPPPGPCDRGCLPRHGAAAGRSARPTPPAHPPPQPGAPPCPSAPPCSSRPPWRRRGRRLWPPPECEPVSVRAGCASCSAGRQRRDHRPRSPHRPPAAAPARSPGRRPSEAGGRSRSPAPVSCQRTQRLAREEPGEVQHRRARAVTPPSLSKRSATSGTAPSGVAIRITATDLHAAGPIVRPERERRRHRLRGAAQQGRLRPGTRKGQGNALAHPAGADDGDAKGHARYLPDWHRSALDSAISASGVVALARSPSAACTWLSSTARRRNSAERPKTYRAITYPSCRSTTVAPPSKVLSTHGDAGSLQALVDHGLASRA